MKVLEITGEPILHGGQEKFIANLIEKMDDDSIKMDVLTLYNCENEAIAKLVNSKGGTLFELNYVFKPGKSRRFMLKALKDFLENNKYDAVHIHSGSISVLAYGAVAAKQAGVAKRIVHSHCSSTDSLKHRAVQKIFGNIIRRNATDFLACSLVAGEDKYPNYVVKNKMYVVANGIDLQKFRRDEKTRENTRKLLGFDNDTFVIGTVGRFSYQKNTEYALEVFRGVRDELKESRLLLVGDGELKEDLLRKVKELKLEDAVVFTGNVDNVQDYYQAMDLFVLPSRFEGLPFVALEAQATGMPSILSDGVTKEAVICSNVKQIPLDLKESWVREAIKTGKEQNVAHDNGADLAAAGFDIRNTIGQIKSIYLR